jgi:restriction endonuclease S subunit
MKPYPKYKESGIGWIKKIPEQWDVKRLKYTVSINPSKSTSIIDKNSTENVCFLQMEKVNADGTYITDIFKPIKELYNGFTYFKVNDIIFAKITPCFENGKGALLVSMPSAIGFGSTEFHVLRALDGKSIPEFIYYLTVSHIFRTIGEAFMSGAAGQKRVPTDFVEGFTLPCPPTQEQQQIAAYLDHKTSQIDTLNEKKKRLIDLLKEERTVVINQAVTKGLDPNVSFKDSGIEWLGEIPEHWDVKKLKYITGIDRGKFTHRPRNDPKLYGGEHPFIQTGDVANADKYLTSYTQTLNAEGYKVSKEFSKGTVVMAIAANIGDVAIIDFDSCFPDSVVGFEPKPSTLTTDYLYYLLSSLKEEMLKTSIQNTQLNFNVERTQNLKTALPAISEQKVITQYIEKELSRIEAITAKTEKEIELLQEYRTALISEVVTGKIDVRDYKDSE